MCIYIYIYIYIHTHTHRGRRKGAAAGVVRESGYSSRGIQLLYICNTTTTTTTTNDHYYYYYYYYCNNDIKHISCNKYDITLSLLLLLSLLFSLLLTLEGTKGFPSNGGCK